MQNKVFIPIKYSNRYAPSSYTNRNNYLLRFNLYHHPTFFFHVCLPMTDHFPICTTNLLGPLRANHFFFTVVEKCDDYFFWIFFFRMGLNNTLVFCIVAFLLVVLSCIQCRSDHSKQLRPTRGFIKDLALSTARGFGKRAVNMHTINK